MSASRSQPPLSYSVLDEEYDMIDTPSSSDSHDISDSNSVLSSDDYDDDDDDRSTGTSNFDNEDEAYNESEDAATTDSNDSLSDHDSSLATLDAPALADSSMSTDTDVGPLATDSSIFKDSPSSSISLVTPLAYSEDFGRASSSSSPPASPSALQSRTNPCLIFATRTNNYLLDQPVSNFPLFPDSDSSNSDSTHKSCDSKATPPPVKRIPKRPDTASSTSSWETDSSFSDDLLRPKVTSILPFPEPSAPPSPELSSACAKWFGENAEDWEYSHFPYIQQSFDYALDMVKSGADPLAQQELNILCFSDGDITSDDADSVFTRITEKFRLLAPGHKVNSFYGIRPRSTVVSRAKSAQLLQESDFHWRCLERDPASKFDPFTIFQSKDKASFTDSDKVAYLAIYYFDGQDPGLEGGLGRYQLQKFLDRYQIPTLAMAKTHEYRWNTMLDKELFCTRGMPLVKVFLNKKHQDGPTWMPPSVCDLIPPPSDSPDNSSWPLGLAYLAMCRANNSRYTTFSSDYFDGFSELINLEHIQMRWADSQSLSQRAALKNMSLTQESGTRPVSKLDDPIYGISVSSAKALKDRGMKQWYKFIDFRDALVDSTRVPEYISAALIVLAALGLVVSQFFPVASFATVQLVAEDNLIKDSPTSSGWSTLGTFPVSWTHQPGYSYNVLVRTPEHKNRAEKFALKQQGTNKYSFALPERLQHKLVTVDVVAFRPEIVKRTLLRWSCDLRALVLSLWTGQKVASEYKEKPYQSTVLFEVHAAFGTRANKCIYDTVGVASMNNDDMNRMFGIVNKPIRRCFFKYKALNEDSDVVSNDADKSGAHVYNPVRVNRFTSSQSGPFYRSEDVSAESLKMVMQEKPRMQLGDVVSGFASKYRYNQIASEVPELVSSAQRQAIHLADGFFGFIADAAAIASEMVARAVKEVMLFIEHVYQAVVQMSNDCMELWRSLEY